MQKWTTKQLLKATNVLSKPMKKCAKLHAPSNYIIKKHSAVSDKSDPKIAMERA